MKVLMVGMCDQSIGHITSTMGASGYYYYYYYYCYYYY